MAAGVEYRLYLDIMDETAARPGEARQLAWEDVRFVEPPYMVLLYTRKTADGSRISRRMEISERLASSFAA